MKVMFVLGKHSLERLSPQERISCQWYSSENGQLPASSLVWLYTLHGQT